MPHLLVLTGPPGAGKSTVARLLVREWDRAVHMHTDDFYAWIARGYVEPWLPAAQHQNTTVMHAIAGTAKTFVDGGFDVVVDGIVGPWFLDAWRELDHRVEYVVLRPDVTTAEHRAEARGDHALKDLSVVATMHAAFSNLGDYERHVVDSTNRTAAETASEVRRRLDDGTAALG